MWLWFFAAIAAYFIKGLCGFANTLIFTSILSFNTANANISPVDLVLGYPSNLILTWQNRKKLDSKIFIPLIILVLAGSIPGALMLKSANISTIKLIFGIVVIILGAEMLLQEQHSQKRKSSRIVLTIIGILSGLLCGMFGIGALLAAYMNRVTEESSSFKANISAVLIADNTFRVILYSILHILTPDTVKISLLLMPFALLGLLLGIKFSHKTNEKTARKLIAILLILSGISLFAKNL